MLSCFFPLAPRMSGRRDVFGRTCGLIAVFSKPFPHYRLLLDSATLETSPSLCFVLVSE